jgi:hypothetical protein
VAYEGGTSARMTIANDALGASFLDFLRPALANMLQVTKGACYDLPRFFGPRSA